MFVARLDRVFYIAMLEKVWLHRISSIFHWAIALMLYTWKITAVLEEQITSKQFEKEVEGKNYSISASLSDCEDRFYKGH